MWVGRGDGCGVRGAGCGVRGAGCGCEGGGRPHRVDIKCGHDVVLMRVEVGLLAVGDEGRLDRLVGQALPVQTCQPVVLSDRGDTADAQPRRAVRVEQSPG